MDIVSGRGNSRRQFTFPCSTIVKRTPHSEQRSAHLLLCQILAVPLTPGLAAAAKTEQEKESV